MNTRRARNVVSRNAELAVRAAELLDDGLGDGEVAKKLSAEFSQTIKARAVFSFRHADYQRVAAERAARADAASEARLIIESARDAGATFAQAGTDLLSKMFYDMVRRGAAMEAKDLVAVGKSLAKFREIEIAQTKTEIEVQKAQLALKTEKVVGDANLSPAEKQARIREIFGMK
jgi:hypothetical protein